MTLNTGLVLGRDSINGQPMVDPLGKENSLPIDVVRIILQNLKADLPEVALVCKNWKAMADDEVFRQMIRPVQAFGTKEWQKYMGVDAGAEPCLPRRAYGDLKREDGFLTFIPGKVKVTKENGVAEEITLDNLEAIGNLVKKSIIPYRYGECWEMAMNEKRKLEKPHWVWIKEQVIGVLKTYVQQKKLVKEEKVGGGNISGLIDTVISVFMHCARYRVIQLIHVGVNDQSWGCRISLNFSPVFLRISRSGEGKGFLRAWKFFGNN